MKEFRRKCLDILFPDCFLQKDSPTRDEKFNIEYSVKVCGFLGGLNSIFSFIRVPLIFILYMLQLKHTHE